MTPRCLLQILATLAAALAAALACRALHMPLPWLIGPLMATSVASMLGAPTRSSDRLRDAGQWGIGLALGLYFTPEVGGLILRLWWAVLLGIVWALVLGWAFGGWLYWAAARHLPGPAALKRATSFFASAIGGTAEMTLLAERAGARTDLVVSAHSLRLLVVTLVIPLGLGVSGLPGLDVTAPGPRQVSLPGLALLLPAALAGAWLLGRLRWPNHWFIGALAVGAGVTLAGLEWSALPAAGVNAAQLFVGVSLGVRFRAGFLRAAPRWFAAVGVGSLMMIALCVGFAVILSWLAGLHPATLVLATAPGGIGEMAITAQALQLGVPVVTAFQACRMVAILLFGAPLYRWLHPS